MTERPLSEHEQEAVRVLGWTESEVRAFRAGRGSQMSTIAALEAENARLRKVYEAAVEWADSWEDVPFGRNDNKLWNAVREARDAETR